MKKIHTLCIAILSSATIFATVDTIKVSDFAYTPDSITIELGDTVRFVWESGLHPTISETGAWGGFVIKSATPTKDIVLGAAGTYAYYDYFSGAPGGVGMSGEIVVIPVGGCSTPVDIAVSEITASSVHVTWEDIDPAIKYAVQYRVAGTHPWIKKNTFTNGIFLIGLTSNTTYQFRIRPVCFDLSSTFSPINSFTTLEMRTGAQDELPSMLVSPNPNDGKFDVALHGFSGETIINIYDIGGSLLSTDVITPESSTTVYSADLENIASPFVIVKVNDALHATYTKVIIQ